MKIGLVPLISSVHDQERIEQTLTGFMEGLNQFDITELSFNQLDEVEEYDLVLVFVKSGGTENQFKDIYHRLPQPVYLLSTSLHNSLAASMEILSWIKSRGGKGEIIHGNSEQIKSRLMALSSINQTWQKMSSATLGLVGEPSDWLIAGRVNPEKVRERWGLRIMKIKMEELIELYHQIDSARAREVGQKFVEGSRGMVENSEEDLYQASRVYLALKEIVLRYDLNALTLRCFDLVTELKTTGCLALSLLNNEGLIAGCEGDISATVSMLLAYYLTGRLPFMANPVSLDQEQRTVNFAHCTVATGLAKGYKIRSHFESGIGVGIQGMLTPGPVTIFKVGGKDLGEYMVKTGEILENIGNPNACRTQIKVRLITGLDYFLTRPLANHHIIIPGDYSDLIYNYFSLTGEVWDLRF